MSTSKSPLTYASAGVDIENGNQLVENIKPHVKRTTRSEVLGGLGGYAGLFALDTQRYRQPVLVSSTDGVGTKLKLAIESGNHAGIGIDLVAMCVNDIVVCGAQPLFFLDYYATGKLAVEEATQIIAGIADGCVQAGCALIGGETAEMPGMYRPGDYDLAGFCVGIAERDRLIDGAQVKKGDAIIGIASSGPHANGYSLIRKIIEVNHIDLDRAFAEKSLSETLLTPTRIYVKSLLQLLESQTVHAMAHITGGGFYDNIPRVLPDNLKAVIEEKAWVRPEIFQWLQQQADLEHFEMFRTFNCGIGMVCVVPATSADACLTLLKHCGEQAWLIGEIQQRASTHEHQVVIC